MPRLKLLCGVLTLFVLGITGPFSTGLSARMTNSQDILSLRQGSRTLPPEHLRSAALARIRERANVPVESLELVNLASPQYRYSGKSANAFEFEDKHTGSIYHVSLDADGHEVDLDQLAAEDRAEYRRIYGKMTPALAERLASARKSDFIPVVIEVAAPPDTNERPQQELLTDEQWGAMSGEEKEQYVSRQEAFRRRMDEYLAQRAQRILQPVITELRKIGRKIRPDKYLLVVYAQLRPSAITKIQSWIEVQRLDLQQEAKPELNVSRRTIGADLVEQSGFDGTGVRLGQVEVGGRVQTVNPFLAGVFQDQSTVCAAATDHSTRVAGIIRSRNSLVRGVAPQISLWCGGSCNGVQQQLFDRTHGAIDWGAKAVNQSWGSDSGLIVSLADMFYDQIVLLRRATIVKSAGNQGGPCLGTTNVTSPGLAYNVITVGNFNDFNTQTWVDDRMDDCSSFRDPESTFGDREKPEVAAPGTKIRSTTLGAPYADGLFPDSSPGGSGTSFAAPHVTGIAGLLIQAVPALAFKPEVIKAIIMASAAHNVEGAANLSEFDGVGAVSASWAVDTALRFMGGWGEVNYNCNFPDPFVATTLPNLQAGLRTRVVIVWSADPSYVNYQFQPSADINLRLFAPTGARIDLLQGQTRDNTYEIIEFRGFPAGNFRLELSRRNCFSNPGVVAYAFWQEH